MSSLPVAIPNSDCSTSDFSAKDRTSSCTSSELSEKAVAEILAVSRIPVIADRSSEEVDKIIAFSRLAYVSKCLETAPGTPDMGTPETSERRTPATPDMGTPETSERRTPSTQEMGRFESPESTPLQDPISLQLLYFNLKEIMQLMSYNQPLYPFNQFLNVDHVAYHLYGCWNQVFDQFCGVIDQKQGVFGSLLFNKTIEQCQIFGKPYVYEIEGKEVIEIKGEVSILVNNDCLIQGPYNGHHFTDTVYILCCNSKSLYRGWPFYLLGP